MSHSLVLPRSPSPSRRRHAFRRPAPATEAAKHACDDVPQLAPPLRPWRRQRRLALDTRLEPKHPETGSSGSDGKTVVGVVAGQPWPAPRPGTEAASLSGAAPLDAVVIRPSIPPDVVRSGHKPHGPVFEMQQAHRRFTRCELSTIPAACSPLGRHCPAEKPGRFSPFSPLSGSDGRMVPR